MMKTTILTIPFICLALLFGNGDAQAQSAKPAPKGSTTTQTRVICIVNSDTVINEGDASSYRWESKSGSGKGHENMVIITTEGDMPADAMVMQLDEQAGPGGKGEKVIVTKGVVANGKPGMARVHTIKVVNGDTITDEISEQAIEAFEFTPQDAPDEVVLQKLHPHDGDQVTVDIKDLGDGKQVVIVRARKVRIEAMEPEAAEQVSGHAKSLQLKDLSYAPNPNQGRFTLSFRLKEQGPVSVRIHSIDGRALYHEELPAGAKQYSQEIDLGDVPAGVYLLEVQQGSQKAVRRIVVE